MSITKDEMVQALRDASKAGYFGAMGGGSGGGGGGGSAASSSANTDFIKRLSGAADAAKDMGSAALGAASKVAEGGARMSDATDALSKGFAGLGQGGNVFGAALATGAKGLAALGQNIDQNVDTFRKLSDTGLSFGNDIMAMKDQASSARMSIAEMSEVLQKNNASMLGFGATSAASAKQLSKMSNEFFTSGLGEQLRGMGYTTKELNDVLAVSISGSKIKDLNDQASQARALKSAASLATEMDAVAKITGQSKQEQLDELRRKATDGQRMAAIDEAIAKGGEGAKEAFDAISANGKLMGPQFQKLAEDMASMGRPSEGMEAAYGLLSSGAKKLMSEAGEAARSGDRERAAQLTKQAAAEQAAFQSTSQYRTMAAQAGIKETQESYAQGAKFRNALESAGKELGPMATDSEKTAAALRKLDEQVKAEQQAGGKDDTRSDAEKAGASITRFAIDVESRGRDLTKAINDQVIQPLVKDIGPELRKAGKAMGITQQQGESANRASTMVDRELSQPVKAGYDKARIKKSVIEEAQTEGGAGAASSPLHKDVVEFNKLIGGNQKQSDATIKVLERLAAEQSKATGKTVTAKDVATTATNTPGAMADIVTAIKKELGTGATSATETEPGSGKTRLRGKESDKPLETLGKGVEALGGLFTTTPGRVFVTGVEAMAGGGIVDKPSLKIVGEAGPEAIFNQSQLENYTAKIMGAAAGTMPKMEVSKFETPKFDLSSMSKSISTSISSVSGGNQSNIKLSADDIADMQKPFKKSFVEISDGFDDLISDSSNIVKENSEKIKADITDALPIKEMAAKQEEFQSQFSESQQKIIDDYKGYSEENRSFHAQAMEAGIKEDTETAQIIGARISKMKADIGDRQTTEEEQAALENQEANKKMFEQQVEKKKEMLDVMQNLGDYSAKRELELKKKSADAAIAIEDKKAIAKNKADDDFRAAKAAFDSAVPEKINDPAATPKKSMADLMGGLSFSPTGMPIMKSVDAAKKSITAPKPADPEAAKEAAASKAKEEAKKTTTEKKPESTAAGKESTLSDVVSQLNTLNKQMGQLIAQQEDLSRKQVNAVKSNNSNILAR